MAITASLVKPTLLLDEDKTKRNIARMAEKARNQEVRFRPHFKTHQSGKIGGWFRQEGVEAITVSSVDMAGYFAGHGWEDITIAFPLNCREGLYSSHLTTWRRHVEKGTLEALSPRKRGPKAAPPNPLKRRVEALEKETQRLRHQLRQAEIIIEVQKKISEILHLPPDPKGEQR